MRILLVVVLQILLIGAELFVLRAFVDVQWTQEWVLRLFWNNSVPSVMATATSAHLLCLTFGKWPWEKTPRIANGTGDLGHFVQTRTIARRHLGRLFMRLLAGFVGAALLLYSIFTVTSVSVDSYKTNIAALRPMLEKHATMSARMHHACAAASTIQQHRPLLELDTILRDEKSTEKERRLARAERAAVLGSAEEREQCIKLQGAVREAHRELLEALPSAAAQAVRIIPGVSLESALTLYPNMQGVVVWFFSFLLAATLHAVARVGGTRPERSEMMRGIPMTDVVALGVWLSQIRPGAETLRLSEIVDRYVAWCGACGHQSVDDVVAVKSLASKRLGALGLRRTRRKNEHYYVGISVP